MTFGIGTFSIKQVQPCHCEHCDKAALIYCNKTVMSQLGMNIIQMIHNVTVVANVVAKTYSYAIVFNDGCGTCFLRCMEYD